jgi:hypothetical protein
VEEWTLVSAGSQTAAQCICNACCGPTAYPVYEVPIGHCPQGPFSCSDVPATQCPHESRFLTYREGGKAYNITLYDPVTMEFQEKGDADYCKAYPECWGDDVFWSTPRCKLADDRGREGARMDNDTMLAWEASNGDGRQISSLQDCLDAVS